MASGLFNALNSLKANIFGSATAGVPTSIPRSSAIDLAQVNPLGKMEYDPFAALNALKANIFGGGGGTGTVTPIARRTAIEMADTSPTSALNVDPYCQRCWI